MKWDCTRKKTAFLVFYIPQPWPKTTMTLQPIQIPAKIPTAKLGPWHPLGVGFIIVHGGVESTCFAMVLAKWWFACWVWGWFCLTAQADLPATKQRQRIWLVMTSTIIVDWLFSWDVRQHLPIVLVTSLITGPDKSWVNFRKCDGALKTGI